MAYIFLVLLVGFVVGSAQLITTPELPACTQRPLRLGLLSPQSRNARVFCQGTGQWPRTCSSCKRTLCITMAAIPW